MLNKKKYSIYNSAFLPSLATKPHKGNRSLWHFFNGRGDFCYNSLATVHASFSSLQISFVTTVWLQCTLRSVRCKLAFENIFFFYIHTEKYSLKSCVVNFDTQISSSHSEEWTMVFTREKKWYVQSEATEVCEFRAKIPPFSCSLLSAASHTFKEKSFSQRVFSR